MFWKTAPKHSPPQKREVTRTAQYFLLVLNWGGKKTKKKQNRFYPAWNQTVHECCQDSCHSNHDIPSLWLEQQALSSIMQLFPPYGFTRFYSRICKLMRSVKQKKRSYWAFKIPVWQTERTYLSVKLPIRASGKCHPSLSSPARLFCFNCMCTYFTSMEASQMSTVGGVH